MLDKLNMLTYFAAGVLGWKFGETEDPWFIFVIIVLMMLQYGYNTELEEKKWKK